MLRLLAERVQAVDPAAFPYHLHGKMTECHLAFWRDVASCDHLVPVARGGASTLDNLVTACYFCNTMKQSWLVEELGWQVEDGPVSAWDGLVGVYEEAMRQISGAAVSDYHRRWLRALKDPGLQR